ncbi:hypothetical protein QYF36_006596 [Acer negundo]|nr:hypothetical protein QYF36_006596 [Acer negundo]
MRFNLCIVVSWFLLLLLKGNLADPRTRAAFKRRGIEITSLSRPIRASDFKDFDLILAMDKQNREDIVDAFNRWKFRESLPEDAHKKVKLICSYCKKHDETEVPDRPVHTMVVIYVSVSI